jgi:hypothetical protein
MLYKFGNLCSRPGVQGVVTRNTIASPTQQSSSLLVVYPVPTNEAVTTESRRYNCFIRNGGKSNPKTRLSRG